MSKRMPFQVVSQDEINKKKGALNQDPKKQINIIQKEKKIIKIDSPKKKITIIKTEKTPTKENIIIKKITKENLVNLEIKNESLKAPEIKMRNVYSIKQLLQLEPKNCPPPTNYQEFPEILRTGGITKPIKKTFKSKKNFLQKRSPAGELKRVIVDNLENIPPKQQEPNIQIKLVEINENKEEEIIIEKNEKKEEIEQPETKLKGNLLVETDIRRLEQRQKQIDLGKKTLSYYLYCKKVPKNERKRGHPITPRKSQICSKRSWDGQIRKWRRMLHEYDPKTEEEINEALKLYPEEASSLISQRGLNAMEYYDVIN